MAHRAYKSIHEPMAVPDGFTLEPTKGNPASEEPSDYTTVLIPLTTEQAKFMTTVATKEAHRVDKIPGYMRALTLGFIGVFYSYSIRDAVGYMSWLIHSGHDSTEDMSNCYTYRVSLHTAEILQRVYEKNISIFNRGYIGLVLQLHERHTWVMTEIERNTGTFFRIGGDIRNLYRSYNLENGYMVLQHIVINIEQMLGVEDKFDRKHAGFSMAINQYTYAAIQAVPEPLRTRLFHYILEKKLQLSGEATTLAPGQAGYSDQRMREMDSAVILSQHNGYKMMHSKRIQEENN